ncbi:MAG: hypothetical protein ACK4KV_02975 [Rhodocyclaceae bacterium]
MNARRTLILLLFPLLAGCDMFYELLEIPNPKKEAEALESEGRAIGGACRHAGRSLEDCYLLNAEAPKSAIFAGWRDMNDYMLQNNLEVVPSEFTPQPRAVPAPGTTTPPASSTDQQE